MASRDSEPSRRVPVYPWLKRDYFKTSVAYLVSLGVHALILFGLLAVVVLDGGGGPGNSPGGTGEMFSTTVGHGRLAAQTDRTDESRSLQEQVARAVEQIDPLPEIAAEVTPEVAESGVQLSSVAPKVNPIGTASSLRNLSQGSTGGGMAVGPGIGMGGGLGGGIGRGFGRGFGDYVGLMQKWGFDVVFVIDGTNSMESVVDTVQSQLRSLVGRIQKIVPNSRVGFVIYKDKGEDFTARMSSLSFHADKLQSFVNSIKVGGGGNYEEAVYEGMRAAIEDFEWRKFAQRVIVLVPSSPAHAGERDQLRSMVEKFHAEGGMVHTIDLVDVMHRNYEIDLHKSMYGTVPDEISPLPQFLREMQVYFQDLAHEGGGEAITLQNQTDLTEELMIAAFGPQWRQQIARYQTGG